MKNKLREFLYICRERENGKKKKKSSRDVNFKPVHRGEKKGDVQQLSYTTDFLGWVAYSHKNL